MEQEYIPPKLDLDAFHCPLCGTFSHQVWSVVQVNRGSGFISLKKHRVSLCLRCEQYAVWVNSQMVHPMTSTAPLAHAALQALGLKGDEVPDMRKLPALANGGSETAE